MKELSREVLEQLENARDNKEADRIIRDNGYDPEEIKKSLSDEDLMNIDGGVKPGGTRPTYRGFISCPKCHISDKTLFSRQAWASLFSKEAKYRCTKCNTYFKVSPDGRKITMYDPEK